MQTNNVVYWVPMFILFFVFMLCFFERSFMYAAPTFWNKLSQDTRMLDFVQFKSRIKTEL